VTLLIPLAVERAPTDLARGGDALEAVTVEDALAVEVAPTGTRSSARRAGSPWPIRSAASRLDAGSRQPVLVVHVLVAVALRNVDRHVASICEVPARRPQRPRRDE
jgi:hypothetical protein